MDRAARIDETALPAGENRTPAPAASADDLAWAIVQMRAGEAIVVNDALIAAYQSASSAHSIRALRSDLEAFDLWCRRNGRIALPATPESVADYLGADLPDDLAHPQADLPRSTLNRYFGARRDGAMMECRVTTGRMAHSLYPTEVGGGSPHRGL